MGLKETIAAGVKTGFKATGNIPVLVTYRRMGTTAYNATTGVPATPETIVEKVPLIMVGASSSFLRAVAAVSESKVPRKDTPQVEAYLEAVRVPFRPKEQDEIWKTNGAKYVVVDVTADPTDSLYTLGLRLLPK